ncbi:MAG: AraC family transcriptional regulator [Chthoniobacteraceae bacterium]|nr:AraC family transcriptional regulator [Chthoniobacteraceae bacterium]
MENLVKHWAPFPRRFPALFPLINADYVSGKNHWIRTAFNSCNFSLILRGRGEYRRAGRVWAIQAPCVLTQWPGEYVEYGPPVPEETWDEFYLIYAARTLPEFRRRRLVDPERPVWSIGDLAAVEARIAEFAELAASPDPAEVADRVDRVCERLVLETHLAPPPATPDGQAIRRLIAEMQRHPAQSADFEALAQRHGMSASTFRRRWAEAVKLPPARFLRQLRLREACRLLVETRTPVGEIAHAVGFEDELYFSRCFRKETRMAPRDYRNAYRLRNTSNAPASESAAL